MFAICNIVRRDQKVTGQSQAEMGTISHSTTDTDKAMASNNRKIQESPVASGCFSTRFSKSLPRPPLGVDGKVLPYHLGPSPAHLPDPANATTNF